MDPKSVFANVCRSSVFFYLGKMEAGKNQKIFTYWRRDSHLESSQSDWGWKRGSKSKRVYEENLE